MRPCDISGEVNMRASQIHCIREPERSNLKTDSIRKLSHFNFQCETKTLYQNNFKHIAFFFTLFECLKCNKSYEITLKKKFLWEPEKTNFKSFKFHEIRSYEWRFFLCF